MLDALRIHPVEPRPRVDMIFLSYKVALLLALVTAKQVGELHTLSVSPLCTQFRCKLATGARPLYMWHSMASMAPILIQSYTFIV